MVADIYKVGFTCSTFDLLHAGHVLMLKEAKRCCQSLLVGLQVDPSLDRESKNKPVQSVFERYTQLSAIKYIDEIHVYDTELDLENLLLAIMPDVRFIGEEYRGRPFTGSEIEDIDVVYNQRKHNFSSTELRARCKG